MKETCLLSLGFKLTDGYEALYTHHKFDIKIDLSVKNGKISYPDKLVVHDQTTSNLAKEESYVVLQCVIKLLELGYSPEHIELEKPYELGIKEKGKLDILIKHPNNIAYTMIECKTKKEFANTWDRMLKDGRDRRQQLFSYYQQDKNASILILYTFDFDNNASEYHVIQTTEEMKKAGNLDECINEWNKNSVKQGFFEKNAYQTDFDHDIRRANLQEITEETGNSIYHAFATILRKHSVSDKSNAYNRLFNLFLCKIIDEDRELDKIVEFQWKENDTYIELAKRLSDLYKLGMLKFLGKKITDYTDDDFKKYKDDKNLKKMFDELRFYKNNEFSFVDVFDEESFTQNIKIVKDIVQLLQYYQFRYSHKHQYLGNFFELLLNTGFKQENGQFFTPVPLAEFMVRSLPLKEMIQENDSLPYMIDYACGSGHFLTEGMDEIQHLIEDNELSQTPSVKQSLDGWRQDPYKWAKDYVYGIDNDYRLIKTTKVACFLNGDGEANIIHTNGLYRFGHKDFIGKLEKANQFDILLANPPYSVDGFLHQLSKEDRDVFEFTKTATSNTNDIECFFIERAEQLLKDKGLIGIVLPISILQNSDKLYTEARKILLQRFEIKALFDVGSSGFMATGTNTVIVFACKNDRLYDTLRQTVDKFVSDKKDVVCNGIKNAFSLYVSETYDDMSFEAYIKFVDILKDDELENEKDRMTTFMMTYGQVLPVIKAGDKDKAQKFLGYKFSNAKGSEGLHPVGEGKLYPKDTRERQAGKANYYIYESFLGSLRKDTVIHKDLKEHVFITKLSNLLAWENKENWSALRLSQKKKIVSKYPVVRIEQLIKENLLSITKGKSITESKVNLKGNIPVIAGGQSSPYSHDQFNHENCITISASGAYSGYVWFHPYKIWASDCNVVQSKNNNKLSTYYTYHVLKHQQEMIYNLQEGTAQPHVYEKDLIKLKIPFSTVDEQNRIVSLMQAQDDIIADSKREIEELRGKIQNIDLSKYPMKRLVDVNTTVIAGQSPRGEFYNQDQNGIPFYQGKTLYGDIYLLEPDTWTTVVTKLAYKDDIVMSVRAPVGPVNIVPFEKICIGRGLASLRTDSTQILQIYLYFFLSTNQDSIIGNQGTTFEAITKPMIEQLKIPVPSLEEQQTIVDEILSYESQIDALNLAIAQAKDNQQQIMSTVFTIEDVV